MCPVFVCLQYVDSTADTPRPQSAPGTSGMINMAYQDALADPRPKSTPSSMSSDSLSLSMSSNMEGSQGAMNVSALLDMTGGSRQATPTPSARSALSTPTPSQHSPGAE